MKQEQHASCLSTYVTTARETLQCGVKHKASSQGRIAHSAANSWGRSVRWYEEKGLARICAAEGAAVANPVVVWFGVKPEKCDICGLPIVACFIDGKVKGVSSWANMCLVCYNVHGVGLGTGKGQRYDHDRESKRWVKVEG